MKTQKGYFMARASVSIILCGLIIFCGLQAFGQDWTAEQKEVWDVVKADREKFKQGDLEGVLASRHDDVVIWWGQKPIPYDKELLEFNYKAWFDYDKPVKWELEPLTIKIVGKVASVFYTYKYSGKILSGSSCNKLPPCK